MRCFTLVNPYFVISLNSNALKFALIDLFSTKQSFIDQVKKSIKILYVDN